jgi:hypothetical protein
MKEGLHFVDLQLESKLRFHKLLHPLQKNSWKVPGNERKYSNLPSPSELTHHNFPTILDGCPMTEATETARNISQDIEETNCSSIGFSSFWTVHEAYAAARKSQDGRN